MANETKLIFPEGVQSCKGSFSFAAAAPLDNRQVINIDPTTIKPDESGNPILHGLPGSKTTKELKYIDNTGKEQNIGVNTLATYESPDIAFFYLGLIYTAVTGYSNNDSVAKTLRLDNKNGSQIMEEWTWTEIGTGGDITTSIDIALENYYTKTETDAKISALGTVFRYQKSVTSYDDLPKVATTPTLAPGDVYNVQNQSVVGSVIYPAGTNFVYTSSGTWDALGGESAQDELKRLSGSGTSNAIADGDILTATVNGGTTSISWKKAPVSTTVTVGSVVTSVGGVSITLDSGKQDEIRTIAQDSSKTVDVYSKDIIDAVVTSLNTEVNGSIYWNDIQ